MKVFNSINEITYNDWLEYETMATVECNISNKRRMSVVAAKIGRASCRERV